MKRYLVVFVVALIGLLSVKCGPSDLDLQWEDSLKGYWKPINEETGEICSSIPFYHFGDSAHGATRFYRYDRTDTMLWEVRRRQMNIYYEEAVDGYYIGYNQYNSRSLMHIRQVIDTMILVSQLFNSGFQSDYALVPITEEEFYTIKSIKPEEDTGNTGNNNDNTF